MAAYRGLVPGDPGTDRALCAALAARAGGDPEYWSFRGRAARGHTHGYLQYPAMMVPGMQGALIRALLEVVPSIRDVLDPFMGSGTVMAEAMLQGLGFAGQDINPLSVLLCRAKAGPFDAAALRGKATRLEARIARDCGSAIEADFPGLDRWFGPDAARALSRIRRAVRGEPDLWARRFFWVALAETVRLTGNARTSTFKLHIRPAAELEARATDPLGTFRAVTGRNLGYLGAHRDALAALGLLGPGSRYRGRLATALADSAAGVWAGAGRGRHDLLVTSPPYGDNGTTVPYGQHAYLPLQWIDLADIDPSLDRSCLATTKAIDARSLGGPRPRDAGGPARVAALSPSFARTMAALDREKPDRGRRVAAFYADLLPAVDLALAALRPGAYMIWTVGNRRVADLPVPMDRILGELLVARGAVLVSAFGRAIPSKRMATRNGIAATMRAETVLVARAPGA